MKQRDYQDTHRAAAPLKQAEDAVLLDTSELDFEQSLAAMKEIIAAKAERIKREKNEMLLYYILIPFAWLLWHIGFRIRVEGPRKPEKGADTRAASWRPPMSPPSTRCSSSLPGGAGG